MSLKQWAESTWTKALARGAMIATPLLLAGFAGAWAFVTSGVATDLAAAKVEILSVKSTQSTRTNDAEAFQREVRGAIVVLNANIAGTKTDLTSDINDVKVDVGVIRRLVIEMRDQQLAAINPLSRRPETATLAARPQNQ